MVASATITEHSPTVIEDFRGLLQEFIRRFGLLDGDRTPCGMPLPASDAHALMCLLDAGEPGLPQTTLVARLGIDKSTASRLVTRMSDRGHVASAASPDDGRARPVRLTRKGVRVARELEAASTRRFAALLEGIPARRRTNVISALGDIVAALDRLDLDQGTRS
jgi:DNA-binding MarR family transcriptional regulator